MFMKDVMSVGFNKNKRESVPVNSLRKNLWNDSKNYKMPNVASQNLANENDKAESLMTENFENYVKDLPKGY